MRILLMAVAINFAQGCFAQSGTRMTVKVNEAEAFCKKQGFNTQFCFLIDMSIHSGKDRFFVYDFKQKRIIYSGLVCHGTGKSSSEETPVFANEIGSNCTSLGKYKTGIRSYSNWGIHIHYKMHGLEKTNSNAFKRQVVLHSYDYVSDKEIYPMHLTMGWSLGCPVISNSLMTTIDTLLRKNDRPTLLWIFE